jgi:hypothetical protein
MALVATTIVGFFASTKKSTKTKSQLDGLHAKCSLPITRAFSTLSSNLRTTSVFSLARNSSNVKGKLFLWGTRELRSAIGKDDLNGIVNGCRHCGLFGRLEDFEFLLLMSVTALFLQFKDVTTASVFLPHAAVRMSDLTRRTFDDSHTENLTGGASLNDILVCNHGDADTGSYISNFGLSHHVFHCHPVGKQCQISTL